MELCTINNDTFFPVDKNKKRLEIFPEKKQKEHKIHGKKVA